MAAQQHAQISGAPLGRYALLLSILLAIYAVAVLDYVFVEGRSVENAVLETACTALYVNCSGSVSVSTKVVHVLVGLATMAVLVVLVSAGMQRFFEMELGGKSMEKKVAGLKGHFVICGYGALGKTFSEILKEKRAAFVVLDKDESAVKRAKEDGCLALQGDALDFKALEKAGVMNARRVVAALDSDSSNVFLALTVHELNPYVKIASRAFSEKAVSKLHRAGADYIVVPDVAGGLQLAKEVLGLKEDYSKRLVSKKE